VSRLPVENLRRDGGTQLRVALDAATVEDYAAEMGGGTEFPPVVAFRDGETYWLADGFHRVAAAERSGRTEIDVDVRAGSRRDAIVYAAAANRAHGLRLTNADKRAVVTALIRDTEWSAKSNRDIARHCGVTHPFVAKIRAEVEGGNGYHPTTLAEYEDIIQDGLDRIEALSAKERRTVESIINCFVVECIHESR
jgi:hypothetical protein